MHRLLKRQIKRHLGAIDDLPTELNAFLDAISDAYEQADADRDMLERSIELTSQELLQTNAQLRAIIPDLFLRMDIAGTILDYKLGATTDRYLSTSNPIGQRLGDILPEDLVERFYKAIAQIQRSGDASILEHSLCFNGKTRFYEVRLLRLLDTQVIAIVRDITERKLAEVALRESEARSREQTHALELTLEELQKTQVQLIQTEKMSSLGRLVAGIAHELNNPVNFIQGNLTYVQGYSRELIKAVTAYQTSFPALDPDLASLLEEIDLEFIITDLTKVCTSMQVGVDRVLQIVSALQNFSRLDEQGLKATNLHADLDSTLVILAERLGGEGHRDPIQVVRHYYPSLPKIQCYPALLNQVFVNLISNAIDALEQWDRERSPHEMASKPSCIEITTEFDASAPMVKVIVRDNGPGIPTDIQGKIFDPFFTTKPVGQGTGLGLSVAHQIVTEQHHGQLTCRSSPESGTALIVQLPIRH